VQNAAARLVMGLPPRDLVGPALKNCIGCRFIRASSSMSLCWCSRCKRISVRLLYQRSRDISQLRSITAPTPLLCNCNCGFSNAPPTLDRWGITLSCH